MSRRVCVEIDLLGDEPVFIFKDTRKRARPSTLENQNERSTTRVTLPKEDLPIPYRGAQCNGIYMKRANYEMAVCGAFFL